MSAKRPARAAGAGVSLIARPMWRLRLGQELPRRLLHAAAAAGLIASIRFAIAPPRPHVPQPAPVSKPPDLAAEGFATQFARAYLTWQTSDPEARREALEPFLGAALAPEAGTEAPTQGSERVTYAQVVEEREPRPHLHVCSIAVQTDKGGLLYLDVPVLHRPRGELALAGYPAFVGAPAAAPAKPVLSGGSEVQDPGLRTVIARALANYLAPAPNDLAADLAPAAEVSPPQQGLELETLQSLTWAMNGRTVVAQVAVVGANESHFTLAYEVGVINVRGRWEIASIEASN